MFSQKIRYVVWFLVIVLFSSLILTGCGQKVVEPEVKPPADTEGPVPEPDKPEPTRIDIRWGTITAGGAWQVIGGAMLEDIKKANSNITGSILPSTTSGNVVGVHQGQFEVAFCLTDTTAEAWAGEGYFKDMGEIRDIRNLAAFYPQTTHIVVWSDSDIKSIEDLKGKRVSPGAKGLSCDVQSQRLLNLYGMSYDDMSVQFLSFNDAAQQMVDRHLDALLFVTVPFPFAPVINVGSQRSISLLSIPEDKLAELAKFQGVEPYTLPAGLYEGVDYPVKGIAVRAHIIVRDDFPEDVAYSIVKTIAEKFDSYPDVLKSMSYARLEDMAMDTGIPMHPGAERYYRERGWMK
ncbi:MAG: TAXI family TRAP transporter solute-binding subunit [Bacillota bacterium]|nr:TAXI family TRAP transporter solute-binding subunit [Bacillota bacterium]